MGSPGRLRLSTTTTSSWLSSSHQRLLVFSLGPFYWTTVFPLGPSYWETVFLLQPSVKKNWQIFPTVGKGMKPTRAGKLNVCGPVPGRRILTSGKKCHTPSPRQMELARTFCYPSIFTRYQTICPAWTLAIWWCLIAALLMTDSTALSGLVWMKYLTTYFLTAQDAFLHLDIATLKP